MPSSWQSQYVSETTVGSGMPARAKSAGSHRPEHQLEVELVDRLRAADESAFVTPVGLYQPRMLRLAEATVGSRAVAEEVTQDPWLAVLRGVERFEGRSSLKTWLFHILLNRARSAANREQRAGRPDEGVVEDGLDKSGAWATPPEPWADRVDDRLVAAGRSCAARPSR